MTPQLARILTRAKHYWPDLRPYDKQRAMAQSLACNVETVVVSANGMGKDWAAGWLALLFFMEPWLFFPADHALAIQAEADKLAAETGIIRQRWQVHSRRIVTTSVRDKHLDVLWGMIGRFLLTSAVPLIWNGWRGAQDNGGPLIVNHHEVRLAVEVDAGNPYNYLTGFVSKKDEGMAGHHAAYTLLMVDEASGMDDSALRAAQGWAKKFFIWGNPNPTNNFFYRMVKQGDLA